MRHRLLRALLLTGWMLGGPPLGTFGGSLGLGTARAETPWLGVEIEKTPDKSGARITDILPESPLLQRGTAGGAIRRGDTITAVDGALVQTPAELVSQVQKLQVGQKVALGLRNEHGMEREVTVTLTRRMTTDELQGRLVDKPAPEISATGVLGAPLPFDKGGKGGLLSGLRGKPVLLDFFATWCGPCIQSVPHLSELQRRHPGLRVVGLSDEEPDLIRSVMQPLTPGYTIARDAEHAANRAYRIVSFPTLVLIDSAGVVRAVSRGNLPEMQQAITALLGEEKGGKSGGHGNTAGRRGPQGAPQGLP
ncbi:MAG: redoxin domain-containing protein [Polyangia bacterium]